eukprot:TRINITY_DN14808_c0_g1_i1.p1 TRINITY_DN14808_c0_g1~~TRINITY_DN14808_c0_g1_i1.p1  ORF type:complete len:685 (+),score=179.65 TRINITY_DN14808_c0_g1_i1:55-2055(+)
MALAGCVRALDRGGTIDASGASLSEDSPPSPEQSQLCPPAGVADDSTHPLGVLRCVCADSRGRRDSMQDAHVCVIRDRWGVFAVLDGHAGHTCAAAVAKRLADEAAAAEGPYDAESLRQLWLAVDRDFIAQSTHPSGAVLDTSGSTCTLVQVSSEGGAWSLLVANLGDSRTLECRQGKASCLTRDHCPADKGECERIRAAGGWISGKRVDGMLAVSRSFGDAHFKQSADGELHHKVIALPDVTSPEPLSAGDMLFLCCDGVFEGGMEPQDVADVVHAAQEESSAAAGQDFRAGACAVVDLALQQGSCDNVTCMVVWLGAPPAPGQPSAPVNIVRVGVGSAEKRPGAQERLVPPPVLAADPADAMRAGRFERSDFMKFCEVQRRRSAGDILVPPPPVAPVAALVPISPRRSGAHSPVLAPVEQQNHHIVTLSRYDVEQVGDASLLGRSCVWAAVDGGSASGWASRDGGCASGIRLQGGTEEGWNRVAEVKYQSPAWRAGVRASMDVVALEGRNVTSLEGYEAQLRRLEGKPQLALIIRSDPAQWARVRRQMLVQRRRTTTSPPPTRRAPRSQVPGNVMTQTLGGPRFQALERLQSAHHEPRGEVRGLRSGLRNIGTPESRGQRRQPDRAERASVASFARAPGRAGGYAPAAKHPRRRRSHSHEPDKR